MDSMDGFWKVREGIGFIGLRILTRDLKLAVVFRMLSIIRKASVYFLGFGMWCGCSVVKLGGILLQGVN
jgi:hypothetical protein